MRALPIYVEPALTREDEDHMVSDLELLQERFEQRDLRTLNGRRRRPFQEDRNTRRD